MKQTHQGGRGEEGGGGGQLRGGEEGGVEGTSEAEMGKAEFLTVLCGWVAEASKADFSPLYEHT